jgi:Kef-type K+ transport system membrane component KefB
LPTNFREYFRHLFDLLRLRRARARALGFGVVTFSLPLAAGFLVGRGFGYQAPSSSSW